MGSNLRVLVNLTGLRVAGGRSVAINLLRAWRRLEIGERLLVVGPEGCGYEEECSAPEEWYPLKGAFSRGWARPIMDHVILPKIVSDWRPDVVLTLSNMACRIPSGMTVSQVVLIMWPYVMYDDPEVWGRLPIIARLGKGLRRRYIILTSRRADVIVAQTEVGKRRLEAALGVQRIEILPTAASLERDEGASEGGHALPQSSGWLCLSRYYPHKNLEVLVEVGALLREADSSASIWLTLAEDQGRGARKLLQSVRDRGLHDHVRNLGPIPFEEVPSVYKAARGVVLPSLLESFSQVFIEAMAMGVPLIAPDRDFARAVCGDAAVYADPLDARALATAVLRLEENEIERARLKALGLKRASAHPTWTEIGRGYVELCRQVARDARVTSTMGKPRSP